MMEQRRTREDLHNELLQIVGPEGHCYFESPSHMQYPCIRYDDAGEEVNYGDNVRYNVAREWTIMVIDPNPDSELPAKLLEHFHYLRKDRVYAVDGLYHFVFRLYY